MAKRKSSDPRLVTDVELELMQILWDRGPSTVREVIAKLPPSRNLAYTTVSTVLRILEQKGLLSSQRQGRSHIYEPLLSREAHRELALAHLVTRVFEGDAQGLVAQLIDTQGLSQGDLNELKRLIDERLP